MKKFLGIFGAVNKFKESHATSETEIKGSAFTDEMSIGISLCLEIIVLKICSDLSASVDVLSSPVVPSKITTIVKTIEKNTYNRASMESETTA